MEAEWHTAGDRGADRRAAPARSQPVRDLCHAAAGGFLASFALDNLSALAQTGFESAQSSHDRSQATHHQGEARRVGAYRPAPSGPSPSDFIRASGQMRRAKRPDIGPQPTKPFATPKNACQPGPSPYDDCGSAQRQLAPKALLPAGAPRAWGRSPPAR